MLVIPFLLLGVSEHLHLVEIMSVGAVGVYKLTKKRPEGPKRVFRMTPVHHHFELGGWRENKIVLVFSLVTLLLAAVAWFGL
jgi:phospho-N-acetylmuramoyl-pentapeptide-transferase